MNLTDLLTLIGIIVGIIGTIVTLITLNISWHGFWFVIISSLLIACLLMWGRWQGKLQTYELNAFDHLMRQQPIIGRDKKILVVSVTENDIKILNQPYGETGQGARALSDRTLERLLERLKAD